MSSANNGFGMNENREKADAFFDTITANPLAQAGVSYVKGTFSQNELNSQLGGFFSFAAWRYYFDVTNAFVFKRLLQVLFPYPFIMKDWQRKKAEPTSELQQSLEQGTQQQKEEIYQSAKDDEFAPDLYIGLMSFITYILMVGFIAGGNGTFKPETLSMTATIGLIFVVIEVCSVKLLEYIIFDTSNDFRVYMSYLSLVFVPFVDITVI